ncbi:MAG: mechanosensitive ion channel [Xanthomonadales bacterium]|nr:mechanosensitive ion channel [Xanthomonadales bacterium]
MSDSFIPRCANPSLARLLLWLALTLTALPVPAQNEEQQFVEQHPVIRYAADPDFAPIDFIADGVHQGLARDYLRLIAKGSGLRFELRPYPSWADALAAFERGEVDMLSGAFVSADRERFALFSAPYFRLSGAIVTLGGGSAIGNVEQLAKQSVGLVDGTVWRELLGEDASRIQLRPYPDLATAIRALTRGEIAALVADPVTTLYQARRLGLASQIQITGQLDIQAPLAMAVRSDWPRLQAIINDQLATIDLTQEQQLRARWISAPSGGTPEPVLLSFPEPVRPRLLALQSQLDESEQTQRQLLTDALKLEDQADALIERLQAGEAVPEAATDSAPDDDNLADFLLWRASLPERASSDQLQSLIDAERAALVGAEQRRESAALRLRDLNLRQSRLSAEVDQARERQEQITVQAGAGESTAQALLDQARQRLYRVQAAALQDEIQRNPARRAQASDDLRRARQTIARLRQRIAALNELQRARVIREAEARAEGIAQASARLQDQGGESARIAAQNMQLAERLVAHAKRYAEVVPEQDAQARASERVNASLELTRQRLQLNVHGAGLGKVLAAELRNLDPPRQAGRQLSSTLEELAALRLEQIDLSNQRERISTQVVLSLSDDEEVEPGDQLSAEWRRQEQLATQRDLIDDLSALAARLQASLERISRDLEQRQRESAELERLIDERLLWLPTQTVLTLDWLRRFPEGVADLLKPSRWLYSARLVTSDLADSPLARGLMVLLAVFVWIARQRGKHHLKQLAEISERRHAPSMTPTVQALLITLFAAAFWPLLLYLLGGYLQSLGVAGKFTDSLGLALRGIAPLLAPLTLVHWLTLEYGLAAHFGWRKTRYLALNRLNFRLMWIGMPVALLARLQDHRGSELGSETLARPALMLMLMALAWLIWRATRPAAALGPRPPEARDDEARWWQRYAHWPVPAALLGFALLQAAGYSTASFMLFTAAMQTFYLIFLLLVLRQLVLRWLLVQERKLAERRHQQQVEARREEARNAGLETSDAPPTTEPEEITVASIGSQTRRLLRAALVTLGGVGVLWVWSDLMPALQALDAIELWRFSGAEGEQIVSLRLLLLSLLALTLTTIAARNLPGLLEIGILQRVPIDAATRYAVTSLCRYVIVIGGLVYGISLLGVRWSHLQWMAAALTVGLGFGLQEIFANFVSGLILLFERPFRVGDTITVDNLSGTVTRIRTRATTILDWDNKEIVVPNKTFITGQLVNWTLADSVTRVTIKIGTAYGSDPEQVLNVLRELAQQHPRVLPEPKPTSWLTNFGNSSLDFELRVFVSEIRDRLPVATELSTAIHRRFRELGIEIPFPQLDVHMRGAGNAAQAPESGPGQADSDPSRSPSSPSSQSRA